MLTQLFSLYLSDGLSSLDLPLGVGDPRTVELVGLLHSEINRKNFT